MRLPARTIPSPSIGSKSLKCLECLECLIALVGLPLHETELLARAIRMLHTLTDEEPCLVRFDNERWRLFRHFHLNGLLFL